MRFIQLGKKPELLSLKFIDANLIPRNGPNTVYDNRCLIYLVMTEFGLSKFNLLENDEDGGGEKADKNEEI